MNLVEEAVRHWEMFREGTIAELENIPERDWDYRPEPGARTLRELAVHIGASGLIFASELARPDTAFRRVFDTQARADAMKNYPRVESRAEVLDFVRKSGVEVARHMRELGSALETQGMATRSGEQCKLSGFWFAIAHEMYHRGQVTAYERALGLTPVMTRQTQAAQAQAAKP